MKKPILIGSEVVFDSEHGIQTGRVANILPNIGSGPAVAIVQVEGTLSNAPWQMPVDQLQHQQSA